MPGVAALQQEFNELGIACPCCAQQRGCPLRKHPVAAAILRHVAIRRAALELNIRIRTGVEQHLILAARGKAKHPNAARLFLDFLLSREGQALYVQTMGWTSARADVAPPGYKEMPSDVKTLKSGLSPEDALKVRDEYVAKWKQLWGLGKTLPH